MSEHSNVEILEFLGICKVMLGPRKGNLDKHLLCEEAQWAYSLKGLYPL